MLGGVASESFSTVDDIVHNNVYHQYLAICV